MTAAGSAVKHFGGERVHLGAGGLAVGPARVMCGLENASEIDEVATIWVYGGASSMEDAGYAPDSAREDDDGA